MQQEHESPEFSQECEQLDASSVCYLNTRAAKTRPLFHPQEWFVKNAVLPHVAKICVEPLVMNPIRKFVEDAIEAPNFNFSEEKDKQPCLSTQQSVVYA